MLLNAHPDSAVAIHIEALGISIQWYAVLITFGITIAFVLTLLETKRRNLHKDTAYDLLLWVVPLGLIGARLYYVLFELDNYLADPISILYIWKGGLAIYGAIIGGLLGIFIYAKHKKISFLSLCDMVIPGVALAQAIGRWGNYFNQEAFGPALTSMDHAWFPLAVKIEVEHTITYADGGTAICTNPFHYATFFYESMCCLIIFVVLWFFLRKRVKHNGDILLAYVTMYSFERMFIEGLRSDSLYFLGMRVSQVLSALLFIAAIVFIIVRSVKEKRQGRIIGPIPSYCFNVEHTATAKSECDEPTSHDDSSESVSDGSDSDTDK